ncbi:uncharacterized protein LOC126335800 [Schistocerca gregaria]|uniref:uncharacterized protein LOC126335800 n=1 Tax=Schistocerca gregaria TaxID=7010 RepID=UPI00211DF30B|nr:uncharacterized protein LOC126335800 [Schistocerca gregaria]
MTLVLSSGKPQHTCIGKQTLRRVYIYALVLSLIVALFKQTSSVNPLAFHEGNKRTEKIETLPEQKMKLSVMLLVTSLAACLAGAQRYPQYARPNATAVVNRSEEAGVVRTIHTSKDGRTRLELRKTYDEPSDEKPKFSGFRFSHRF